MPIINFVIPPALNKRVEKTIKERGFASKAEFFRMAAFNYMNTNEKVSAEERLDALTKAIKEEVARKYWGRKLPSLEEQLVELEK